VAEILLCLPALHPTVQLAVLAEEAFTAALAVGAALAVLVPVVAMVVPLA
jgi:hypothetical protein